MNFKNMAVLVCATSNEGAVLGKSGQMKVRVPEASSISSLFELRQATENHLLTPINKVNCVVCASVN